MCAIKKRDRRKECKKKQKERVQIGRRKDLNDRVQVQCNLGRKVGRARP